MLHVKTVLDVVMLVVYSLHPYMVTMLTYNLHRMRTYTITCLTEGASSGISCDTERTCGPLLMGHERPAFDARSHSWRLVEMNGMLFMTKFTFSSPPVTLSSAVCDQYLNFRQKEIEFTVAKQQFWTWHYL